jgi:ATP-dependent helicase/nuclease subunit B
MKGSFLYKISKILLSKYEYSLSDLVIVLPSRRSSVFLIKELSQLISKPVWLPEMYSIEDFFFTINNLKRATNLELFFKFYTIYRANVTNPHSIERCYKWANGLINDFNEIDKGYVNHIELFNYLSDVKRIENWYLDIQSNQNEINDYSIFFKSLGKIYKEFADCLLSDKISYSGLSQRLIVDNLDKVKEWMMDNKKKRIIFLGLDALSTSQEKIIDYLIKDNLCDIFWDADKYFVENIEQESGKFLRDYRKKWPSKFNMLSDDFIKNQKEIKIIGTSKNISQSKLLGSILNSNKYSKEQLKKVAIILPNEDLLLPVLESIPKKVD